MQVTVIGNGGREKSIEWKLRKENHSITDDSDFIVVGPEAPIAEGMVEQLQSKNKTVFAPSKLAGRLETSKVWSKKFMRRYGIPTADFVVYKRKEIEHILPKLDLPYVVKEDGLCGGKGVALITNEQEQMVASASYADNRYKSNTDEILIEQLITGEEASCFVLTDGDSYKVLPYCQDHKRARSGDQGPNTGGMGAYAPAPLITKQLNEKIINQVVEPTLQGMKSEGNTYRGVLYIGLMIENNQLNVIEYNVRFGDPECQVLMMLMKSDLLPYLKACTDGTLHQLPDPEFYTGSAITICMCNQGYPEYTHDLTWEITGLDNDFGENVEVFHAGVKKKIGSDKLYTNGGRILNVTARADSLSEAKQLAESVCDKIHWDGCWYRDDIGHRAL